MENDQDPPFPREPWQGLLQDRGDAPPEMTDARIRAAARKAVSPRAAGWWLPASLAASFLLAVVLVQLQFGERDKPTVITEADLAEPAPAREPVAESYPAAPPRKKETAPRAVPFERPPVEFAPEPEARVGGPEQDLKSASEWVEEEADNDVPPLDEARELREALAKERTPEAWYAEIEALRKAGRIEEADAELKRLEAAHPGWLEQQGLHKP